MATPDSSSVVVCKHIIAAEAAPSLHQARHMALIDTGWFLTNNLTAESFIPAVHY